jgi:hypothetical protein
MPCSSHLIVAALLLGLSRQLSAEIYETKDPSGNPVFSDMPSEGASA